MPCDPHSAIIITRKAAANARCRFSFFINVDSIARTISKEFNNVENTTQGAFVPNSDIRPVLVRVRPANGFEPYIAGSLPKNLPAFANAAKLVV